MTFTLDAQVAAVLAAATERSGPPPAPPAGDVASRRVALDVMLGYFNNQAQPVAGKVDISDHSVVTPDGATLLARWYRHPSGDSRAAVLYLHGGGMIAGSVPDPYIAPFAGWSYDDNATAWDALLGTGHEHREVDPAAAPGRLQDAAGLPPAYIEVGQLDIFRDEALRYALTLSQAGVPVELHLHPGVPHEYDAIAFGADVSHRAQSDRDRVLRSL
ncbi:MAG TPA: alpha/beta hydrolase fold domain-containing protein [Trebonia sp.]|jgi:acetyl esterase/lipase|nr:alpha/beta hydrolase fold domain-containing protein [Trebonia sp.]